MPIPEAGLRRKIVLFQLFLDERENPAPFYTELASDTASLLADRHGLAGQRVLDLGCGPGWYSDALREQGAEVCALEYDSDELARADRPLSATMQGDAMQLAVGDASLDGIFCSNMLEHVPDTERVLREIGRALRPGGWAYVSWTNWYSPWGGHDMTPWHLLGPDRGSALYEKRNGPPRKNRYGEGLYAVHIGPTLRLVEQIDGLEVERAEPRYWRRLPWIVQIPGAREFFTWNCVMHLRKV